MKSGAQMVTTPRATAASSTKHTTNQAARGVRVRMAGTYNLQVKQLASTPLVQMLYSVCTDVVVVSEFTLV